MAAEPRPDEPTPPPDPVVVCDMCRRPVPERQTSIMQGRRLCFGCASAWFDDEE